MGTDYPYDMAEQDPVGFVGNLSIPEADKKKILGKNLRGILGGFNQIEFGGLNERHWRKAT